MRTDNAPIVSNRVKRSRLARRRRIGDRATAPSTIRLNPRGRHPIIVHQHDLEHFGLRPRVSCGGQGKVYRQPEGTTSGNTLSQHLQPHPHVHRERQHPEAQGARVRGHR
jgi:hypothetical protein